MDLTLSPSSLFVKRSFDFIFSLSLLIILWPLILILWLSVSFYMQSNGFFIQNRVGLHGRYFKCIKLKTMYDHSFYSHLTSTTSSDPRITPYGSFLRRTKLDELPQLWNVLIGDMSFVGPRPDVPGYANTLQGEERKILSIRPGITGPATLKYRNEEDILSVQTNPERYNRDVIWPDKVQINLDYIQNWSLERDIRFIFKTVFH